MCGTHVVDGEIVGVDAPFHSGVVVLDALHFARVVRFVVRGQLRDARLSGVALGNRRGDGGRDGDGARVADPGAYRRGGAVGEEAHEDDRGGRAVVLRGATAVREECGVTVVCPLQSGSDVPTQKHHKYRTICSWTVPSISWNDSTSTCSACEIERERF